MVLTNSFNITAILHFKFLECFHRNVLKIGHLWGYDHSRTPSSGSYGWLWAHKWSNRSNILGKRSHWFALLLGSIYRWWLNIDWILLRLLVKLHRKRRGVNYCCLIDLASVCSWEFRLALIGFAWLDPLKIRTFSHIVGRLLSLLEEINACVILPLGIDSQRLCCALWHQGSLIKRDLCDVFVVACEQHFSFLSDYNFSW